MNRTRSQSRAAGYSLIELALVLTLLAIFGGVANKLFMLCFVIKNDALKAGDRLVHTGSVIRLIRSDVWNATSISSDSPDRVTIDMADGSVVCWEVYVTQDHDDIESLIYRIETKYDVEVTGAPLFAPADLVFQADGNDLYLSTDCDTIRMTSMYGLLEGAKP
jgi:prepilin-type N-terminal cleavage/methylation domain-containing protein